MGVEVWGALSSVEAELMTCALEGWGILAYATDGVGEDGTPVDVPAVVLSLVDRGWVRVHRLEPWTGADGRPKGARYGPPVPRAELPALLRDPATWDDPPEPDWFGAVTLSVTEEWDALVRAPGEAGRWSGE